MTNSSKTFAGDELLRIKALRAIERETILAPGKGHKIVVIGYLNFRPSESQLSTLDRCYKPARVPGFNHGDGHMLNSESFAIVKEWGLVLRNGLFKSDGLMTRPS